jgi:hypothetical protein
VSIEKERKAFESQNFIKRLLGYSKYNKDRNEYVYFRFEDYAIRDTCELNTAWKAWQASANREGYKLVPVEPTKEMFDAGEDELLKIAYDADSIYKAMIGACE